MEPHYDVMERIVRGEEVPTLPVRVFHVMGRRQADFLWAEMFPLIHIRIAEALTSARISGWRSYPIEVQTQQSSDFSQYRGFAAVGRCGSMAIDEVHSELVHEQSRHGEFPYYKGLWIATDSWDGSDIFVAQDRKTSFIVASCKAAEVLRAQKASNVLLQPTSEVRVFASGRQGQMADHLGHSKRRTRPPNASA